MGETSREDPAVKTSGQAENTGRRQGCEERVCRTESSDNYRRSVTDNWSWSKEVCG